MRKLFALYTNELIKIFKRVSVVVMLIIMIVLTGLYTVLSSLNYSSAIEGFFGGAYYDDTAAELEARKEERAALEIRIKAAKESSATDAAASLSELESDLVYMDNEIYILNLCVESGIQRYTDVSFRREAIEKISQYLFELISLRRQAGTNAGAALQVRQYEEYVKNLSDIVKNNDYKAYIELSKKSIQLNTDMTEEERKIELEYYDLLYLNDPNGTGRISGLSNALLNIKNERSSLLSGINTVDSLKYNMPLSMDDEEYIKNKLAVDLYNVEHGYLALYDRYSENYSKATAVNNAITFGTVFVAILIMILAGTAISKEIATGSIKSLIIAPVKRWKIMTAKVLALLTVTLLGMLLLFIFSLGLCSVMFGTSVQIPYVYANAGKACELPYLLYQLTVLGVSSIKVIVYSAFALLLSTVTRNSALSVGLSIGTYFGVSSVSTILTTTASGEWTKFIPFEHFNMLGRIFTYSPVYINDYSGMFGNITDIPLLFSAVYLVVLTVTMMITSYDSFNHRDIK